MLKALQSAPRAASHLPGASQPAHWAGLTGRGPKGTHLVCELPLSVVTAGLVVPPPLVQTAQTRSIWQKAAKVLSSLATLLVVTVAGLVMMIAVTTRVSAQQQLNLLGHPLLVVLSGSMGPAINTGDLIINKPVSAEAATRLRVGQIITFRDRTNSAVTLTHRIQRVVRQGGEVFYETKGDANDAPDASLRPASDVIGTYVRKIPRGGYFLTNLRKPIVLGLFLLAPILWFIGEPLRRMARELDEEPTPDPSDSDGTNEATP